MRKARFTEHQVIAVIKLVEAGRTVKDVCREAGISEATWDNWKSRYGGMEASDIKKIKDLEDENRRLKQMNLSRTVYHYRPDTTRDEPVIVALQVSGRAIPTIRFSETFSGSATAGVPVESQKAPPYLLSAEAEFSS